MGWYIGRRLIEILPVFIGVILVVFAISHLTPGDPVVIALGEHATPAAVEKLRAQLQLNDPLPVQFVKDLGRVLRGDLGRSIQNSQQVTVLLSKQFAATIELTVGA